MPPRPRFIFESLDSRSAVRVNYIRAVALRGDREGAARSFHPRVETVHEDHPTRWRCCCRQQQRVVATTANSRHRSAGKAAEAVRLEPLGVRINWIHHAQWNRSETAKSPERKVLRLSAF